MRRDSAVARNAPLDPLQLTVDPTIQRLNLMPFQKCQQLAVREGAAPGKVHVLHAFSAAFVSKPSRRNTEKLRRLVDGVLQLLRGSRRRSQASHHRAVRKARSQELFEIADAELGREFVNALVAPTFAVFQQITFDSGTGSRHGPTIDELEWLLVRHPP